MSILTKYVALLLSFNFSHIKLKIMKDNVSLNVAFLKFFYFFALNARKKCKVTDVLLRSEAFFFFFFFFFFFLFSSLLKLN